MEVVFLIKTPVENKTLEPSILLRKRIQESQLILPFCQEVYFKDAPAGLLSGVAIPDFASFPRWAEDCREYRNTLKNTDISNEKNKVQTNKNPSLKTIASDTETATKTKTASEKKGKKQPVKKAASIKPSPWGEGIRYNGVTLSRKKRKTGEKTAEEGEKKKRAKNQKKHPKEDEFENIEIEPEEIEKLKTIASPLVSGSNTFFSEISKYPLLTAEKEHELAMKIRNDRDPEAFHLFLMSNMRLALACVRDVMRRMGGNTILDFMDLSQEAVLGLMTAVERFDPTRGTRFSTYGLYWIYQRVKRAIVSQRKGMSVPGFAGESVFAMNDYIQLYISGREQDIPKRYLNRVRDLARITNSVMSFGEGGTDEDTGKLKSGVVDEERFTDHEKDGSNCYLGEEAMRGFFISDFHDFLSEELTSYEADIVRRKFGLSPYNVPASHKEIGLVYKKSSETIRLNIDTVLKRLKKNKRAERFMAAWLRQS